MLPDPASNPLPSPLAPACARKTAWHWALWLSCVFCLVAALPLTAQGTFFARNDSTTLVLREDGTKMPKVVGRVEIVFQGIVLSTARNTFAADGIFVLGPITVPGVGAGGTATITVRVWDSSVGATFDEAVLYGRADGATFDVVGLGTGTTLGPSMANFFKGLTVEPHFCLHFDNFTVQEGDSIAFTLPDQGTYNGRPASLLTNTYTWTGQPHSGTFSGILPNVTYRPTPRSYAPDSFTYLFPLGLGFGFCLVPAGITVLPAPERSGPALVSEVSGDKVVPKLRGLNLHRYRVERSADLTAWGLAGEVTGNFTEVDLSTFLALGVQAQYLRATDLTPQ